MADRFLDLATSGPLHLKDPRAAKIVQDSILFGAMRQPSQPDPRYALYAWCVMANHVHVLLKPTWDLEKITQGIKGYTAHEINRLQDVRGRAFWQDESFDHWVRDEEELRGLSPTLKTTPLPPDCAGSRTNGPGPLRGSAAHWPIGQPFRAELLGLCGT